MEWLIKAINYIRQIEVSYSGGLAIFDLLVWLYFAISLVTYLKQRLFG